MKKAIRVINQIIDDSLKDEGKWMPERLQMFVAFAAAILLCLWTGFSILFTATPLSHLIIEVIALLLAASGFANVVERLYKLKNKKYESKVEPETPIDDEIS